MSASADRAPHCRRPLQASAMAPTNTTRSAEVGSGRKGIGNRYREGAACAARSPPADTMSVDDVGELLVVLEQQLVIPVYVDPAADDDRVFVVVLVEQRRERLAVDHCSTDEVQEVRQTRGGRLSKDDPPSGLLLAEAVPHWVGGVVVLLDVATDTDDFGHDALHFQGAGAAPLPSTIGRRCRRLPPRPAIAAGGEAADVVADTTKAAAKGARHAAPPSTTNEIRPHEAQAGLTPTRPD